MHNRYLLKLDVECARFNTKFNTCIDHSNMKSSRSRHMLTFGGGVQAKGMCYSATMIEDQSNITFNCQ